MHVNSWLQKPHGTQNIMPHRDKYWCHKFKTHKNLWCHKKSWIAIKFVTPCCQMWPNMGKCVPHSFSNAHWCHLGLLELNSQLYWNMFSNMKKFHVGWWKIRTWVPMCKHVFPNGTKNVTEAPHINAI
jgi:hypothetical protein